MTVRRSRMRHAGLLASVLAGLACLALRPAAAQVAVTTHHGDAARTGWNYSETALTYQSVADHTPGQGFGLLRSVGLDEQVDAQPLVVPKAIIDGDPNPGTHDVVFVATEANTVYAIDPTRGTVLNSRNFGAAIANPLGCTNNSATVGINSTPVIDPTTNSLYLITYTNAANPIYTLHRLALHDFSDVMTPTVVTASYQLPGGGTFTFSGSYQRQRAALLLENGAVYAAFASFCDMVGVHSRGWLLGWNAASLAPELVNNRAGTRVELLTDSLPHGGVEYFLSSVWMSGAGPAADTQGNLFLVSSNSASGTYTGTTNIQESAIKFSPTKNQVTSLFTPADVGTLDNTDGDFGSGGILLLPHSPTGLPPRLAAAAGKEGSLFLMNRDSMGGYNGPNGQDNVVAKVQIGPCWCTPTYFEHGSVPRIVSSGGQTIQVWNLSGTGTALVPGPTARITNGQDGGFFTTVSSDGENSPIIWAVGKPTGSNGNPVTLYAFAALAKPGSTNLVQLFAQTTGSWPNGNANANIVPTVANGLVYVASYRRLSVFGLGVNAP